MKKRFLLSILIIIIGIALCGTRTEAQTISSTTITPVVCPTDTFQVWVSGSTANDTVEAFYGDGFSQKSPVIGGDVWMPNYTYPVPGLYTLKLILYASGVAVDSLQTSQLFTCTEVQCFVYNDVNADCTFDAGDGYIFGEAATIEIDSAGIVLNTVTTTCGFPHVTSAPAGTVYAFKLLRAPYGFYLSCPADTVIYDTLGVTTKEPSFGFECAPTDTFDLAVSANFSTGVTGAASHIYITNSTCTPTPGTTLTINYSPKYIFSYLDPESGITYPYTVSGNSVTFDIGGVSSQNGIHFTTIYTPIGTLTLGDTANATFLLNPMTGDVDTFNNIIITCDTIRSSYDPNYKSVMPTGNIEPGTLLKYIIGFENTGNDTAFNIHIMDTISNNLDINTFKVVSCSAPMNLIMLNDGSNNIVKFDFPNIDLLDTAQHIDFSGMVTYTIQAKTGLAAGTKIDNEAGIYFDANAVVMTNNVENIIGGPASVATVKNTNAIQIYPNPTTDIVNITGVQQNTSYSLMDITGESVQQGKLTPGSNALSLKNFAQGIYMLEVTDSNGTRTVSKVVKE